MVKLKMVKQFHECEHCGGEGKTQATCTDCHGSGAVTEEVLKEETCSNPLCSWGWEAVKCSCLAKGGPLKSCRECEGTGFRLFNPRFAKEGQECPSHTHVRGKHHFVHKCRRCGGTGTRKFLLKLPHTCQTCQGSGKAGEPQVCGKCLGTGQKQLGYIPAADLNYAFAALGV